MAEENRETVDNRKTGDIVDRDVSKSPLACALFGHIEKYYNVNRNIPNEDYKNATEET